ncbi:MAG: MFS transporter, partial [Proteobacteria bacterium]|nr:MFS transporter [Pseudomonadota bacterium]
MSSTIERLTGLRWRGQGTAFLVASGHGATHWIIGIFYVLLPYITATLGLSYAQAGGLVTLFHISAFAANAGSGAVVDIGGRRVLIQCASLVIGAASLMAMGLVYQAVWLIPLVVLIGATNNAWHPAAISYLSQCYPDNRGYALSIHTLGASIGDRFCIDAGNLDRICARRCAVIHNHTSNIGAWNIGRKIRRNGLRIRQRRSAFCRPRHKLPSKCQKIPIRVEAVNPV